jgi:phosphoglycolate phosphatase
MKKGEMIIWDWNGTLLNDIDICIESINRILDKRAMNRITKETYLELFRFPVIDFYTDLGFDFGKEDFDALSDEYMKHYISIESLSSLQNGAMDLLNYFRSHHIHQVVLSVMEQETLARSIQMQNILHYFLAIVGTGNFYGHGKMELAKQFVGRSSLLPGQITLLGDTLHDLEVAETLGCNCILIACGHQPYEKLIKTGARVEKNLSALFDMITYS